jgi:hypothetical protein
MLGVDLIRPFTKSRNGNSWCLSATLPSGWRQYPLNSVKEEHVLNSKFPSVSHKKGWFEPKIYFRYWPSKTILSFQEICKRFSIIVIIWIIIAFLLSIKVRLNIDKAQEKQKESYRRKIKKGTKCFDIRSSDLVWKKDEMKARPGKSCFFTPSGVHHMLRWI